MFNLNTLDTQNCPWRWRIISKWLSEQKPSYLATYSTNHKNLMEHVYGSDFTSARVPTAPVVSVTSKTATSVIINVISKDIDTIDLDYSSAPSTKVYDGTAPSAPASPSDVLTLTDDEIEITGLTEGNHYAWSFDATDNLGEGPAATLSVILQPATATTPAAITGATSEIDASCDAMSGASEYEYRYLEDVGGTATEQDIIDDGVSLTGTNSETIDSLTAATQYAVIIRATNPGGNSAWSAIQLATSGA